MGVLEETMWDCWGRTPQVQRPSPQSTEEAILYWVEGVKEDKPQRLSACWQLAQYLDHLKYEWVAPSPGATASGATNVSQVPLAAMVLEDLGEKVREAEFGQRTPPFLTQHDVDHYMSGLSAADPFRTTITDIASYVGAGSDVVTNWLMTGASLPVSAANLVNISYAVKLPDGTSESLPKVHVSFNDSNFRDWKHMPQHIGQAFRGPRGKAPTARQTEVYMFVQQYGGPPGRKGEDKKWWENVLAPKWNETHPGRPLKGDSLRREYQDVEKMLRQRANRLLPFQRAAGGEDTGLSRG
jgi:hypothetical protein